jgi:hypothetical protein
MFQQKSEDLVIDEKSRAKYRRIMGGLAWPVPGKPGAAVVMAEEHDIDLNLNFRPLHILAEIEEDSMDSLFRRCANLKEQFRMLGWLGNPKNNPKMETFTRIGANVGLRRRDYPYPHEADHAGASGNLDTYYDIIMDLTKTEKKRLTFGPGSQLPGCLESLTP